MAKVSLFLFPNEEGLCKYLEGLKLLKKKTEMSYSEFWVYLIEKSRLKSAVNMLLTCKLLKKNVNTRIIEFLFSVVLRTMTKL